MNLEELLADWLKNDEVLSQHFAIAGRNIIDNCHNNNMRMPLGGLVYGEVVYDDLYVRVVASISTGFKQRLRVTTLNASKPDFFKTLREILINSHNEISWCKTVIE